MPSIASIFRPKIIRRVILTMLLAAPIVYLFGTQIGALAGAHGEEVLAETPYQGDWIETSNFQTGEEFKFVFFETFETMPNLQTYFTFHVDRNTFASDFINLRTGSYSTASSQERIEYVTSTSTFYSVAYRSSFGWQSYPMWATIYFESSSLPTISLLDYGTLYYKNPVQNVNYHDSLFMNMFGRHNFLTDWGTSVLDDTAVGFEPVNALLQYVGGDMLHLGDTQIGLMALGYSTYVFNVLIVYMLVSLCASLICLPLKATDIFNRGENL